MRRLAQLLIVLFIALLVVPAFLPDNVEASVEKELKLPAGIIYEDFNNLYEFSKWEPWASADSAAIKEYFAPYKGKGAGYKWVSNKNEGIFTIVSNKKNELINYRLEGFGLGKNSEMTVAFTPVDSVTTQLSWHIESEDIGYFSRYFSYFNSENLKEKMDEGLNKLEVFLKSTTINQEQAKSLQPGMIVNEQFEGQKLICILNETSLDEDEIKTATEESLGLLYSYLTDFLKFGQNELGNPVSYIDYVDIAAKQSKFYTGYPITESVKLGEGMELFSIPANNTLVCIHKGDYTTISQTIDKMKAYAQKNKLKTGMSYWEEYLNDPELVKNKEELLTKIYIPVKE